MLTRIFFGTGLFLVLTAGVSTAAPIGVLVQITPLPVTLFAQDVDFRTFEGGFAEGAALGVLEAVDIGSGTSGCEFADFAGFTAGSIALIERGECPFSAKVNNATLAGAVGALIFDSTTFFPFVILNDPTTIPALFITNALGQAFLAITEPVNVAIVVVAAPEPAAIPEPTSLVLFGSGILGVIAKVKRRQRQA